MFKGPSFVRAALGVAVLGGWLACSGRVEGEENAAPAPGTGRTLYVEPHSAGAADDGPGTKEKPWKTLDRAFSAAAPGDTVYVKGSTDPKSRQAVYDRTGKNGLDLRAPGEPGKPISFVVAEGQTVILDGGDRQGLGIALEKASHHRVQGFVFRNFKKAADGQALVKDLVIRKCEFTKMAQAGLKFRNVEGLVMADCRIHDCADCGVAVLKGKDILFERVEASANRLPGGAGGDGEGFTTGETEDVVFLDCVARDNSDDGFDLSGNNTVMVHCLSEGHRHCNVKLWNREGKGKVAYHLINCLLKGAKEAGVKVASPGVEANIYSCVSFDNEEEGIVFRNKERGDYPGIVSNIANCIVANNRGGGLVCPAGIALKEHHNLYHGNKPRDIEGPTPDGTSLAGKDPLFADTGVGDFRLKENSPAAGAGVALPEGVLAILRKHATRLPEGRRNDMGLFRFDIGIVRHVDNRE